VARVTLRGTHRGDFLGIAPTHRAIAYEAIDISRFADGKLVEHWGIPDYLTLLQQLGVTRLPGA
jgi:predicted ester cyclase